MSPAAELSPLSAPTYPYRPRFPLPPYPAPLPDAANVTKREESELRRLRSDANVTKREVFQSRTPERGILGRLRRRESWAFAGGTPPAALSRLRKLRVLLHLQHGNGSAGPNLRVLLHLHQGPRRAGRIAGAWPVGRGGAERRPPVAGLGVGLDCSAAVDSRDLLPRRAGRVAWTSCTRSATAQPFLPVGRVTRPCQSERDAGPEACGAFARVAPSIEQKPQEASNVHG